MQAKVAELDRLEAGLDLARVCSTRESLPAHETENPAGERPAERRRRQRLALIEEFGGDAANLKSVAVEAIRRGMYSQRTNRGDVELCLMRTWKLRHRGYAR